MNEWNLLTDKHPELNENGESGNIIVWDGEDLIDDCRYIPRRGGFIVHPDAYDDYHWVVDNVTHWMYLPKPPIAQA